MAKTQGARFGQMERAIVAAAGDLFDRQGFNQTSLQDIADILGLARPSLYHYFDNREKILAAGVELITDRRNAIMDDFRGVEGDPAERLQALVLGLGTLVAENPVWVRVLLRDEVALPEDVLRRDYESRMAFFALLVEVLSEGMESGYVRPLDEQATALTIISALTGLQGHYVAAADSSADESTRLTVDIILHGVLEMERRKGTPLERGLHLIREGTALIERNSRTKDGARDVSRRRSPGPGRP